MKSTIVVIGTGGHARVVVGIIKQMGKFKIAGCLDRTRADYKERISGVPVVGTLKDLRKMYKDGTENAALAIGDNKQRRAVLKQARKIGFSFPALIHPKTRVEPSARVGKGAVVCTGAIVGAEAILGEGSIINSGSIVDHETNVGSFAHVAPGCMIAGRVKIGEGAFIGLGSKLIDGIKVGKWATVGAGAVAIRDVPKGKTVVGVPAKVII